ncbi:hypothetical protein CVIRNUC_002540 [Coccomyxa viridis]|uniref:Carnitine deficiency associated protein n=1 Tax=Coccomyxa viridis TaxID=1274662 RepID=A0AAV1I0I4_9CHLO|nr:hypothetical protein CVIRNUC_002540 [Coccomyxa viridis]
MSSAHQQLLLQALRYPKLDNVQTEGCKDFRSLIVWLEHTKIRHYATEDRKALSDIASKQWPAAFLKYLTNLECPLDLSAASASNDVLDWLLHYAVDLEYGDRAEQVDKQISSRSIAQPPAPQPDHPDLQGVGFPELQAGVTQLLDLLQLPHVEAPLAQQLATAKQVLAEDVLPALKHSPGASTDGGRIVHVADLQLGFSTGDDKLDTAAMILRMLFIKDLRKLQTQIDEMIVQVQEYTANPRIDSALGLVGR